MSTSYEELDVHPTPLGELVLRRRRMPGYRGEVYEITLGGSFLMSSLVNDSERALARAALAMRGEGAWRVLIGGLGLGYTAEAALASHLVSSLTVVELFPEVIAWHEDGRLPIGRTLAEDPRCRLVPDDFFALFDAGDGDPDEVYDLILVDIDHSPEALLHAAHGRFYEPKGLERLHAHLAPGGVFGLWAGHAPDGEFLARLDAVFAETGVEIVRFFNPHVDREDVNTVYLARRAP